MAKTPGVYEIPRKFSGEDRYLKYFPAKAFVYLIIGATITVFLVKLGAFIEYSMMKSQLEAGLIKKGSGFINFKTVGFVVGIVITGILLAIGSIKVPETYYVFSGGAELDVLIKNYIKRRFNRVIYTKYAKKRS